MAEVYAPDYLRDQKDPTLHSIADMIEEQRAKLRAKDEEIARLADGGARWAQNAEHFRKEAERLRSYLERMDCSRRAVPAANDKFPGALQWEHSPTCLRCQALEAHSPVDNADAPAPPDMSIKQEKSDTLTGPVDAGDTSTSCSETAGTEPTCALTPEQVRRLEAVARAVDHAIAVNKPAMDQWSLEHQENKRPEFAAIEATLAALRDSGWRG